MLTLNGDIVGRCLVVCGSFVVFLTSGRAKAQESIAGVIGLAGEGAGRCLAVELPLPGGSALRGLRWHNNDGLAPFPKLAIVGAGEDGLPEISAIGVELPQVVGSSGAWSEVLFDAPVASESGVLYAVFTYPPAPATFAPGAGGGAGIGYVQAPAAYRTLLSDDGNRWATLSKACKMLVEPVLVQGGTFQLVSQRPGAAAAQEGPAPVDIPRVTRLLPPRPNPSNPLTELRFELAEPGRVRMALYNVRGQLVATLVDGVLPAGPHSVVWRGIDARGSVVANGVYSIQIEAAGETYRQHLTLLR